MKTLSRRNLIILLALLLAAFLLKEVCGLPSGEKYPPTFTKSLNGDWYDSWSFNRNYYGGSSGYMPNIAYETLGNNKELAYSIGESFKASYASKTQRAVAILKYVQRWTEYGYDSENARAPDGKLQSEWAWNADEMAHMFNTTSNTIAIGDCEDMAFLCATIYTGAGFDAAMILAPSHAALLIWLPEYQNANYYWDIPDDERGKGWIWVEATGENNPLGWTPPDFNNGDWKAYPLGLMIFNVNIAPQNPQAENNVTVTAYVVSAKASVNQVSLDYSIHGVHNILTMTLKGSFYETAIPKQPKGATVEFYVYATDNDGNTKDSDKFSYTVGKGFEIPGFPWESIAIGLIAGLALLAFLLRKRKYASLIPKVSTDSHFV